MIREIITSPLFIILLSSGVGVILIGVVYALLPSEIHERLDRFVDDSSPTAVPSPDSRKNQLSSFRNRLNNALSILSSDDLRIKLASAHWQITDREYILLRTLGVFAGFALVWFITRNFLGGIGVAVLLYLIPGMILMRSIDRRRLKFQNQLLDALILIRGAVQSGYSLLQALDLVQDEMTAPASEEYGRVVREVQLGLPLNQALMNLAGRMESMDLQMVVTSIIINNQVGGNLTTMLTAVTDTIRARMYIFGEIRALTSYARYAGYLLTFLPFGTGLLIYILNPGYFDIVPNSIISQIILGFALLLLIIGNIWVRRIAIIKV